MKLPAVLVLPALALAASCAAPPAPPAPETSPEASLQVRPSAPAPTGLGSFSGEGTLGGAKVKVEASLNPAAAATWTETRGKEKLEYRGRWRQEEDDVLLLLSSEEKGALSVVLKKEGAGWTVSVYADKKAGDKDKLTLR